MVDPTRVMVKPALPQQPLTPLPPGLANLLCERMLSTSASEGAKWAYLQVAGDNTAALRIYQRLGFVDGYGYH